MDLIWDFLQDSLNTNKINEITFKIYEKDLNDFRMYLKKTDTSYINVTKKIIDDYIYLLRSNYKYKTVYRKVSTLRNFYKYIVNKKYMLSSPIGLYDIKDESALAKKKLTLQDLNSILAIIDNEIIDKSGSNFDILEEKERNDKELFDLHVLSILIKFIFETKLKSSAISKITKNDIINYDYKSVLVNKKGILYSLHLSNALSEKIKNFYNKYKDKELFNNVTKSRFKDDLGYYGKMIGASFNVSASVIRDIDSIPNDEDENIDSNSMEFFKKMKDIYMKIGIGDEK